MNRRAPKNGYDFDEKQEYRKNIWRSFKKWSPIRPCNAHTLLMPSLEGIEIDVAIAHGFLEENLHIVDDNPAIVATLKRRYPTINTYGVDIVKACERIADKKIELACANFDFTSCVSQPLLRKMDEIGFTGVMMHGGLVAINILRGRERPMVTDELKFVEACDNAIGITKIISNNRKVGKHHLDGRDISRISEMFESLSGRINGQMRDIWEPKLVGIYKSTAGNQTMLWAVAEMWSINMAGIESDQLLARNLIETKNQNQYQYKRIRKDFKRYQKIRNMSIRAAVRTLALDIRLWLEGYEARSLDELKSDWECVRRIEGCPKMLEESGLTTFCEELFN